MTKTQKKKLLKESFDKIEEAVYTMRDVLREVNLETHDEVVISTILYNTTLGLRQAVKEASFET